MQTNQRERCKACLIGYHEEVNCYARGPQFLPPNLRRRIMVYNQTHGDKPPDGHVYKEYSPKGVTPDHKSSSNKSKPSSFKKDIRPFSNYHTKSRKDTATIRSFQFIDDTLKPAEPNPPESEDNNDKPTINSFLQHQSSFVDDIIKQDQDAEDTNSPVICSMIIDTPLLACQRPYVPNPRPHSFSSSQTDLPSARHHSPQQLDSIIRKEHSGPNPLPSKSFLSQFNRQFSRLDKHMFQPYCRMDTIM
jgi:hypothetical protein